MNESRMFYFKKKKYNQTYLPFKEKLSTGDKEAAAESGGQQAAVGSPTLFQ